MPNSGFITRYLSSYPLSDRHTVYHDGRSAIFFSIFNGFALPLVGIIGRKLGLDPFGLAILMSSQFVGFLLNLWFGHLSGQWPGSKSGLPRLDLMRKYSARLARFVYWPNIIARGSIAIIAVFPNPVVFLVVMVCYFLLSSIPGPAYSIIMRLNYSNTNRSRAMGQIRVMVSIISAACVAVAGIFMDASEISFRILFLLGACAGVVSCIMFRYIHPRIMKGEAEHLPVHIMPGQASQKGGLLAMLRDGRFLVFEAIFFIIGFSDKLIISLEPIRFVSELGGNYGDSGFLIGALPIAASIFGYYFLSKKGDSENPFVLLMVTVLLSSMRFLFFAIATAPVHVFPGMLFNGIANSGWDLLSLFTVLYFSGYSRLGLYIGLHNSLIGARGLIGPALGTWLYTGVGLAITDIYWIAFGIIMVGLVCLFFFWGYLRQRESVPR